MDRLNCPYYAHTHGVTDTTNTYSGQSRSWWCNFATQPIKHLVNKSVIAGPQQLHQNDWVAEFDPQKQINCWEMLFHILQTIYSSGATLQDGQKQVKMEVTNQSPPNGLAWPEDGCLGIRVGCSWTPREVFPSDRCLKKSLLSMSSRQGVFTKVQGRMFDDGVLGPRMFSHTRRAYKLSNQSPVLMGYLTLGSCCIFAG